MKVDAKTADTLGWFTAIVKRPFHAEWSNYGMPDLATDYKAGEKIRCVAWKPEGMSPCKAAGHPDMWLSWKLLDNCEYSAEDVARLERLTAENSRARNAKFKVGDVVRVKDEAAREIGNPSLARKTGRIKSISGGYIEVDGDLGDTGLELTEHELTFANSCGVRSTNAAVNAALNGCGTAKNAFTATPGDVNRMCNEGLQAGKKLLQHVNEWMGAIRDYQRNPNLQDKYAQDEYETTQGLVMGLKDALRAMGW